MAIAPGSRLGPYEILAPLGAGGMGEVYRARDSKLDREVAIKILPDAVAHDPERLARFEREAKVLASLNHPNVAQIYGVVEAENAHALVMELVPGGPLKGPLSLDKALNYARQIAGALEAAHEKGIVHRDLKPANILVTPAGVVKVLDFGLATQQRESPAASPENSPTFTMTTTGIGVILGTAAYMSPEQARGEPVDKRADVWAFGVVLYEMLTGKGMFEGRTVTDVLAAVLIAEPDLSEVPTNVRRLLRRCLEKDPRKRLRDIGDAMLLLEDDAASTPPPAPSRPSRMPWIVAGVLLLIAVAAGIAWWRGSAPAALPVLRVDFDLGDVGLSMPAGSSTVIVSPDGTNVVYLAAAGGQMNNLPRLYVRKLDQPAPTELAGTLGANSPFFSPDGKWVGFSNGDGLYKVALDGTPPVRLSEPGPCSGSAWGDDDSVRSGVIMKGLLRTPAAGGNAEPILNLGDNEVAFLGPQTLPDGKGTLYTVLPVTSSDPSRAQVEVLAAGGKRKFVAQGGITTRYLPASRNDGYLVYAVKHALYAVPFDLARMETRGAPVQVLDDIAFRSTYESQFDVSRTGTLVYRKAHGSSTRVTMLQWVDAAGKRVSLPVKPAGYTFARLSPDGGRVAVDMQEEERGIQILDLQRETWTPVPLGGRSLFAPVWTYDSRFLIIGSLTGLSWAGASTSGQPRQLMSAKALETGGSTTQDGKNLVYVQGSGVQGQLWTVPLEYDGGNLKAGTPQPFFKSSSKETNPRFSPDGKWIAYASTATGGNEVYVRAYPDNGNVVKISNNGGDRPMWLPGSHSVLYQAGDQMLAVAYTDQGGTFVPEKPQVWTPKIGGNAADLSPDGKRLLVIVPVDSPNVTRPDHDIVLFQNFVEYLREKVK